MIKTENKELNSFWSLGMKPGGLIVIAARPGMGKSSFLLSIGKHISKHYKTQLISLETSINNLKHKNISDSILIDDSPAINIDRLSEIILQNKPEVVLIDYLQLMTDNLEDLIKELKTISVKFNICLIVTSQISREPEYRSDKRPVINDLTTIRWEIRNLGNQYTDIQNQIEQPSYTLLNSRIGFTYNKYSLFVWGQNLTNERYLAYGNPDSSFGRQSRIAQPRTFGLTLSAKF